MPYLPPSLFPPRQVAGIVIVLIGEQIQFPLSDELIAINKCSGTQVVNDTSIPACFLPSRNDSIPSVITDSTELSNSSNTIILCLFITVVNFFILVVCLRPKYRRVEAEKRNSFEKSIG